MRPHLSHPRAQSLRFYAPRPTYYQGIVRRKPAATSSSQFNSAISRWRQRVNRVNPTYLVYGIIATNVGVFSLWALAESEAQRFGDPGKLRSMMRRSSLCPLQF